MAWQTIDTAPKNGSVIIGYANDPTDKDCCWQALMFWAKGNESVSPNGVEWSGGNCWIDTCGHKINFDPTHWANLPEFPK